MVFTISNIKSSSLGLFFSLDFFPRTAKANALEHPRTIAPFVLVAGAPFLRHRDWAEMQYQDGQERKRLLRFLSDQLIVSLLW